ncbi:antitoxin Xre-like helix-turn-helix domain-containing protein [Sphingomonas psychrotolerans]|uniref:DUF2384 domain-containing protein n=1 Tax=Sphingomonas psychrotolerans TaxID=1327635 RepID=A0A2K8MFT1_9SPHN|nr:antitoxin Xre-like helix-turn-helix domain-containing protein [Sphingomonas psychrotolerans]ATY30599.1 DUF2384 domain-containing protein [Sphingomonas psychrotolerans]
MADELGATALQAFFAIAERWSLSELEQMRILGLTSRSTLQHWKAQAQHQAPLQLERDTTERISYVLGIYRAINVLLPIRQRADAWVRAANKAPIFGGRSALDRMTAGNVSDLYEVRKYLDAQLV